MTKLQTKMHIKEIFKEYPDLAYGALGLGVLSFAAGAVRGFQEANGLATDQTLDSILINAGIFTPIVIGGAYGLYEGIGYAIDPYTDEKTAMMIGLPSIGAIAGGIIGYAGTGVGYMSGRVVGNIIAALNR